MSSQDSLLFGTGPVLPVKDVRASVEYYCERLGFTFDLLWGDPPTHGSVTRNRVGIQFTQVHGDYIADCYPGWTYIFVADADRLYEEYRAKDVRITRGLASHEHGMREFEVVDLDGHRLRFGQYLSESLSVPVPRS